MAVTRRAPRLFGLAPGEVYHAAAVTRSAVGSYPTFSPFPRERGGLFSVALSLGFPPAGVTRHRILWSPDFPPAVALRAMARRARWGFIAL